MKMVSQLTRQAMERHRILSLEPHMPAYPPQTMASMPAERPPEPPKSIPVPQPPRSMSRQTPPSPSRPRSIYQQLMSNHDRINERHL